MAFQRRRRKWPSRGEDARLQQARICDLPMQPRLMHYDLFHRAGFRTAAAERQRYMFKFQFIRTREPVRVRSSTGLCSMSHCKPPSGETGLAPRLKRYLDRFATWSEQIAAGRDPWSLPLSFQSTRPPIEVRVLLAHPLWQLQPRVGLASALKRDHHLVHSRGWMVVLLASGNIGP